MQVQSSSSALEAAVNTMPYGGQPVRGTHRRQVTTATIAAMHQRNEPIAMLTAYDATFAAMADAAGIDAILVGDSLGMVCQGTTSTVGVSLESMAYHTECVATGLSRVGGSALVIADLPFGSYHRSLEQAIASAVVLMQAGAQMVKLEGGSWAIDVAAYLIERGIPVCGHLGLTPQTVSALGGYRVQGREADSAQLLQNDAIALQQAGASMTVLEMIPAALAHHITEDLHACPTIGIGAGSSTAGQVLVMHDMLGMNLGRMPKFVKNFMQNTGDIRAAFAAYVIAVKQRAFPSNIEHAW